MRLRDRLHLQRIRDDHPRHKGGQHARNRHAVAGRLDHHLIGRPQVLAQPFERSSGHIDPADMPKDAIFPNHHLVGVQIVGRWILARLRNQRFFSLVALNDAIRGLLVELNNRPLRSWGRSRRDLFDELDRPALIALPDEPYEYAEWKRCRVNLDYHVEIDKHYYSVPYSLARQEVEARITVKTVEIFLRGKRVASHLRSALAHRPTTVAEHMPSSHRRYRDWTHERIRRDAAKVGPDADTLIDVILRTRPHPEQGFRSAIGILGLVKRYGPERVDAACARALLLNARSYKSVAAILKNGTDKPASVPQEAPILFHSNIRGRGYYN